MENPTSSSSSASFSAVSNVFLCSDEQSEVPIKRISRRTSQGFNLIPCRIVDGRVNEESDGRLVSVCYTLPIDGAPELYVMQREDSGADLSDFEICNRYNVDNTGLVYSKLAIIFLIYKFEEFLYCTGRWPSEDVLAYFCLSHADMFRSKKIIELGSGYGLAGLVIAAATKASEVVITDGNPQVIDYIQRSIDSNSGVFGGTSVKAMMLHWDQEDVSNISGAFDVIVASDCTFFKEFHKGLTRIIKLLLKDDEASEGLFLSPKRGDSLDKFLEEIEKNGMHFSVSEIYDAEVSKRHQCLMNGDDSWPGYEKDHCYPLFVRVTR
ncbi:calmodulin-lysine N-methyltransferase isoform X2 [Tripterygium wilfordii]|uniref:calmodulin-lysine N-methyltransferase isoform X2 n=1 Tax=Tripterygium wilfordii TaxID=458696 RepID=UPI0018F81912|nr:calmodulin-lysine N-methyltransferase isoform X2 [Tripterygium wilfordii]